MERKLFCVYFLFTAVVVAHPSKDWASSGWTTESSHQSGWQKTEAKFSDTWKQAAANAGEDSQGKGWISSESSNDLKPKAIPTSWQQVDRHHGTSVKSSGWKDLNPASQEIANGFVVHHPVPSSKWSQSPISQEPSWSKPKSEEFWPEDMNKKSADWEKAMAEEQWKQNQMPAASSSWDTQSAWEKSPEASSTSLWNKNSSPNAWESDVKNDRESAAGYAATGPAQSSSSTWVEKPSNNEWQKNSSPTGGWKTYSAPSTLYDAPPQPSKWNSKPVSGNSDWQKASSGWDSSSDLNTWQKETNGWTDSGINGHQNHPSSVSGWQQGPSDVTTPKSWQKDSVSNGWEKSSSAISNGWDNHSSIVSKMSK